MKVKTNTARGIKVPTAEKNEKTLEDRLRELNDKLSELYMVIEDMGISLDVLDDLDDLDLDDEDEFDFDEDDDLLVQFDNGDKTVMVLFPGKPAQPMKAWEACELMPNCYEKFGCVENSLGMYGLNFYYRKDQVVPADGDEYLIGPAVVCSVDSAANLRSLTGEEIYCINRYVDHFDKVLTDDEKDFPALQLPL